MSLRHPAGQTGVYRPVSQGLHVVYYRKTDRRRAFLPGHRPGVPGTPGRQRFFRIFFVVFSYASFLQVLFKSLEDTLKTLKRPNKSQARKTPRKQDTARKRKGQSSLHIVAILLFFFQFSLVVIFSKASEGLRAVHTLSGADALRGVATPPSRLFPQFRARWRGVAASPPPPPPP